MRYLLFVLFVLFTGKAMAQKASIRGRVYDSSIQKGLAYATVSLVHAKDSTLASFTRADSLGFFRFINIDKGNYLLSTSFVGYRPKWTATSVTDEKEITTGILSMTDIKSLDDVTVYGKRPPVTINNDTLEFNTENFKTQPNAVVEDMLKKMPGVVIESDGTIRVNGQVVRKVLVNGRDFFTGDPKMATKNLSADAVDKVQVFDKKSDRAEFTGIDDGNSETAINLKLKKDRNNALFGRATAGGSDVRYDGQANINQFKGDKQASFLGMGNNTNRQGFSMSDILNFTGELSRGMRGGGGGITIRTGGGENDGGLPVTGMGQNQQGVAQTWAGGLNYNNSWSSRKTDLNTSYTASNVVLETNRNTVTDYLFPGNNFSRVQDNNSLRDGFQQKLNLMLDQKIDSFHSIKITPSVTTQKTKNSLMNEYYSQSNNKGLLNEGYSRSYTNADALNFTNTALLRKKFARKGRTISLNVNSTYNKSEAKGNLYTKNRFYEAAGVKDSVLDQTNIRNATTRSLLGTLTYTEPIFKGTLLELSAIGSTNVGESERSTYDNNGGKYDKLNINFSNSFQSAYNYAGGSLNLRTSKTKYNFAVGAMVQSSELESDNYTYKINGRQRFTDVLPNAMFQYNFSRMKNVRVQYNTDILQPSVGQLQPVEDVSDPINIVAGNPYLKRQYVHNLNINYMSASMETRKNLFGYIGLNKTDDAIVTIDSVSTTGRRKTSYTNTDGVYNLFGSINYGFPLKKLKTRVEIGLNSNLTKGASFLNNAGSSELLKNEILNTTITPSLGINYSKDNKIDVQLSARVGITKAEYSLQKQFNTTFYTQTYNAEVSNYLPWALVLNNQLNYVINTGRSDGFNTEMPIWNASIAKGIGKNRRAEIKLSAFDLLERNLGISRSANQNYVTDQRYNVLQRYFLLGFTYSLNKSGLNSGPRTVIRTM